MVLELVMPTHEEKVEMTRRELADARSKVVSILDDLREMPHVAVLTDEPAGGQAVDLKDAMLHLESAGESLKAAIPFIGD